MKREQLLSLLDKRILVFDGALGTLLQEQGLAPGELPETLNLRAPETICAVQQRYVAAGCDLLQTNTFGANRLKLAEVGLAHQVGEINRRAVAAARQAAAERAWVVGTLGPTGKLLAPYGDAEHESVYAAYREQAQLLVEAGVDLLKIETQSDIWEAKLAVMAAQAAAPGLAIICSLTYDTSLRTLTGTDPETAVSILGALGVAVIGTNCGFGPETMLPVLTKQYATSDSYLLVQPNAGLPEQRDGKTVFPLAPAELASTIPALVQAGANLVGGCCGTTPEHMRLVVEQARRLSPLPRLRPSFSSLSSPTQTVLLGEALPTPVIGERINPTARKRLAQSLRRSEFGVLTAEARQQVAAGAQILDVNVGLGLAAAAEADLMAGAITAVQQAVRAPLSIDTADVSVMEAGLRHCHGKPLLNSINGNEAMLEPMLRLAARYGSAVLGLTLDEQGIPDGAQKRLAIARKIVDRALAAGIRRQDIYIDTLTLTAGAEQAQIRETLRAIALVKQELGVKTVLGVSNVSYGLPRRNELNATFLAMALAAGLDLPIINPLQMEMWTVLRSSDLLTGRDQAAYSFLKWAQAAPIVPEQTPLATQSTLTEHDLQTAIRLGEQDRLAGHVQKLSDSGWSAVQIVNECVVPAMAEVGRLYADGVYFLPQLLLSAAAAEQVFHLLQPQLEASTTALQKGVVIIATVEGDIHDIGKNIVALLLRNYGFRVVDLGKDISAAQIVAAAQAEQADLVALSSLMTTTMPQMAQVVDALRQAELDVPVLIGGAVITAAYATSIGAHYAPDATWGVQVAAELICKQRRLSRD